MNNAVDWEALTESDRAAALRRPTAVPDAERRAKVAAILADVRARGDAAVRHYTQLFDWADVAELTVPEAELEAAWDAVDPGRAFETR